VKLATLIMAAGQSSRFGSCKLLAPARGQPLLAHSINAVLSVLPGEHYLVTGAWHTQLFEAQQAGAIATLPVLYNRGWQGGLGSSIAFAVSQLPADLDAIAIVLGDMPEVSAAQLSSLLKAFTGDQAIVCSSYQQQRGVPAIFGRQHFAALAELSGDRGAKALLNNPAHSVIELALESAARDIDTPQALERFNL